MPEHNPSVARRRWTRRFTYHAVGSTAATGMTRCSGTLTTPGQPDVVSAPMNSQSLSLA